MIGFLVTVVVGFIVLGVITAIDTTKKGTERERLAYYDAFWGFYDTAGDSSKALASVEPALRSAALGIISAVGCVKGWELRAFEGRRTLVRQRELYYKGTGTKLPYKHAFGFAIDLVPWDSKKQKWNFAAMVFFKSAIKKALAGYGHIIWGGTFKRVDMYHFELSTSPALYASVKQTLSTEGLA